MSSMVLGDRDVNASVSLSSGQPVKDGAKEIKSMEYHRQMLQSKIEQAKENPTYVSPSDNIMSPCTAKLSAYRNKQVGKAKPKSLFAKTSAKSLGSGSMFGESIRASNEKVFEQ
ncbi:hypothetical protein F5884DRAFT_827829 [Xylogone sp. PMI_703]|nr:hypothetical protein F5884DRAFT_827829 [Xylogone sp. PMI_703]